MIKKEQNNYPYSLCKSLNLNTLIVNDSRIDGNTFFNGLHLQFYNNSNCEIKSHLQYLSYLDFSGNFIGEKGAISLSNYLQSARALQCLKLSRCNMSTHQLHKIFEGALPNNSGLEDVDGLNEDDDDNNDDSDMLN